MRRTGVAVVLALLLVTAWHAPAGAQTIDYGWNLTAYGSAHTVLTANHMMVERRDAWNNWNGHVLDDWLPGFCQLAAIQPGNAAGVTLKLYFVSPSGSGTGCYPGVDQSRWHGWRTAGGWHEGQHITAGYVSRSTFYVGGRDPASPDAWGTVIEIS